MVSTEYLLKTITERTRHVEQQYRSPAMLRPIRFESWKIPAGPSNLLIRVKPGVFEPRPGSTPSSYHGWIQGLELFNHRREDRPDVARVEPKPCALATTSSNDLHHRCRSLMCTLSALHCYHTTSEQRSFPELLEYHLQQHCQHGGLSSLHETSAFHVGERLPPVRLGPFLLSCHD